MPYVVLYVYYKICIVLHLINPLLACWFYLYYLVMFFCILIHDYTLCFIGSTCIFPCYKVSYYNYISIWPYLLYSYSHCLCIDGANTPGCKMFLCSWTSVIDFHKMLSEPCVLGGWPWICGVTILANHPANHRKEVSDVDKHTWVWLMRLPGLG